MWLRPSSLTVLLASLALTACGAPTAMTRSSVASAPRPLYLDEGAREAEPPPEAPTVVEEAYEESYDEEEADFAAGAAAAPTRSEVEERAPSADSMRVAVESTGTASSGGGGGSGGGYVPPPNLGWSVPVEPLPWVPLDPAPVPARARRMLLATMELPPGRTVFPPVSACQDVLVYVQEGALEAVGTGVGTTDAPATLYPGDAARFGPEGDGRLTNRSGGPATALVVIARAADAGAPLYTAPVDAGLCELALASDPVVRPLRLASTATTTPITFAGLEVRILLDLESTASAHAGLTVLSGERTVGVERHTHDDADEVLYVESGEGTMIVGSERVAVRAGAVVYVPRGVPHSFEPAGTEPLRALQLYAPSGPEQRFRGLTP